MAGRELGPEGEKALEQVLGYLNFSSGASDPLFLGNLNRLLELVDSGTSGEKPWQILAELLRDRLASLQAQSSAFSDIEQASAVLSLVFSRVLPDYRQFHRDLLFHQTEKSLFGPFFLGRVCEAVLAQGGPWEEADRISQTAIRSLNDYIGHRPVAVLENRRIEPYEHEWVRPIPLHIRDAGVSFGSHHDVVQQALRLLEETDEHLLRAAHFDPANLDELAIDPRAYDFDHPVNKRPNYHFGQWDPHHIDNRGNYRRFVVQEVTLQALMDRVEHPPKKIPSEEIAFEAAAVLAGTVLMASGISGSGPDTHDSSVTLTSLLPEIAGYRDAFYNHLFSRMTGPHAERLVKEAQDRRQPFGGARQHLNSQLARWRASQLEHVHLAMIFARMGYPEAAMNHSDVVPAASARMRCSMDCCVTAGLWAIEQGNLTGAAHEISEFKGLLQRAIECGAMIDPWNILGFDSNFSLFPALENSIHDHRADDLADLMEQVFDLYSRLWSESAAVDDRDLCEKISTEIRESTEWWRGFAVHEVSSVGASDPQDVYQAAQHVSAALNLWHKGGAAAGDVAFWAPHVEMFDSGRAYGLVVEALLERRDFVASMSLLVHWLGQADEVGLDQGELSFYPLVERWLVQLQQACLDENVEEVTSAEAWKWIKKFFDCLEANADEYWRPPNFEMGQSKSTAKDLFAGPDDEDSDDEEEEDDLYGAAYEDVVYRDSTDDGVEGEIYDTSSFSHDELELESKRIMDRLSFLTTIARLWSIVATGPFVMTSDETDDDDGDAPEWTPAFRHWISQAAENHRGLLQLMDKVEAHQMPKPSGDHDSLVEYDNRRLIKETLVDRIVTTSVETSAAIRHLLAAAFAYPVTAGADFGVPEYDEDQLQAVSVFACMLRRDTAGVRLHWPDLLEALSNQPLLYVPLQKGGDPRKIVAARVRQQSILDLLLWLPKMGMLTETRQLLEAAREMERDHPVGLGAVTEYDELFKVGYKSLVGCLVTAAQSWDPPVAEHPSDDDEDEDPRTSQLVECLEQVTESLLVSWLAHSRTLRLSVLEKVSKKPEWQKLVNFIESYGEDLFTQKFFNLGNLRAILHEGVEVWLEQLEEESADDAFSSLLEDLDESLPRDHAVEQLSLVLEAIVENYGEYRDYNSTTTQSDRGQLLYTLLDFLRLRTDYDRVSWNLKPVVWAHEILVRRGQNNAAQMWCNSLSKRIRDEARKYLARLTKLQKKYAMNMPTVADRIGERFIRPMQIDRIRALIQPAVAGAHQKPAPDAFGLLEIETDALTREPTGVGLDVPAWLIALEDEVETVRRPDYVSSDPIQLAAIPQREISLEEARRQIDQWSQKTGTI